MRNQHVRGQQLPRSPLPFRFCILPCFSPEEGNLLPDENAPPSGEIDDRERNNPCPAGHLTEGEGSASEPCPRSEAPWTPRSLDLFVALVSAHFHVVRVDHSPL